ncbi:2-dehydro-3-deoxygluconokinase [Nocardiopsis sp. Huas11]|uniref:sugar kinase n=1 Tax=Nocardiopsis sp. Huas11 TaxID=2183912 RepID=UPI000F20B483|nr:2-dehydro-3-deoxygluconokinase [Nocardiopsis sp. Huas11]
MPQRAEDEPHSSAHPGSAPEPVDAVCVGETMALLIPDGPPPEGPGADAPGPGGALRTGSGPEAPAFGTTAGTGSGPGSGPGGGPGGGPGSGPGGGPCAPPRFHADIGGAESNVAVHLARAGRSAAWLSALGEDPFGDLIRSRLTDAGVRCVARTDHARTTGLYMKEPGPEGTRVRYWRRGSAASTLGRPDAAQAWRLRPRLVHTSGITAALSPSADELVEELLDSAPPGTLRSFDVNYRPALHDARNADRLLDLARRADLVFCGLDEAQSLWGVTDPERLRELLRGPDLLVVKQGARGATAVRGDRSWFQAAPRVEVVEPVGAGDAFAAGFLDRFLDDAPMPECLAEGARLAGIVLGLRGDIPAQPVSPRDPDASRGSRTPGASPATDASSTSNASSTSSASDASPTDHATRGSRTSWETVSGPDLGA